MALVRRAVAIEPQAWRPDPPDADDEYCRITTLLDDSPDLHAALVNAIERLKLRGRSERDIDVCIRAMTEPRYTICARYAWNRPIKIKCPDARPWATPFKPGALTHAQAFVREMFHVVNAQYLYDHVWSLVCSYDNDPFHHDISRFMFDVLERFYRDDRMSAEWDATAKKMTCCVGPDEFVHKTPKECAIDIIRVIMDVLFSGVDAYWPMYPDTYRPKNIVDPDRDWCILFPPEPNKSMDNVIHNTIPTWPKRMVVREKLHEFFEREIKGHRVVDILTHRVSKDDRAELLKNPAARDRALLANVTECVTLTAIFLKGKENVRWTF